MPLTAGRIWRMQDDEHIHNVVHAGRRAHTQCGQHYSQQNTCCGRVPVRSEAPVTSLACGLAASRGPHSVFRPTSGAAQQVSS